MSSRATAYRSARGFTTSDPPPIEAVYQTVLVPNSVLPAEGLSAVAGLKNEVYLGTDKGTLLHVGFETQVDSRSLRNSHSRHYILHKEVAKKRGAVTKIICVFGQGEGPRTGAGAASGAGGRAAAAPQACAGLFSLAGGDLTLHRPDLYTECKIGDSRRPILDIAIAVPDYPNPDDPFEGLRLVALQAGKLIVYHWAAQGRMSNRQLSLPSTPLCATINSDGLITIGYSREYNIVEERDGRVKDIHADLPKSGRPVLSAMPGGEVLVFTTGFGLFIKPIKRELDAGTEVDFHPSQRGTLVCDRTPDSVMYSHPLLGLVCDQSSKARVDVFALASDMQVLQQLELGQPVAAASDNGSAQYRPTQQNGFFDLAMGGAVWRVHQNPVFDVVSQMQCNGDTGLAEEMLYMYMAAESMESYNAAMERHYCQTAVLLWLRLEFRLAMSYFRKIRVHPMEIAATMPWLLPAARSLGSLRVSVFSPDMLAAVSSGSSPPNSCISTSDLRASHASLGDFVNTGSSLRTVADMVLAKRQMAEFEHKPSKSGPIRRSRSGRSADPAFYWGAVKSSRMAASMREDEDWESIVRAGKDISSDEITSIAEICFIYYAFAWLKQKGEEADDTVGVVHRALIAALVRIYEAFEGNVEVESSLPLLSSALRICKVPIDDEIYALLSKPRYRLELADFYMYRGNLHTALQTCKDIGTIEAARVACTNLACSDDEDLIRRHCPWVFTLDHDLGLRIFMSNRRRSYLRHELMISIIRDAGIPDVLADKDSPLIRLLLWMIKQGGSSNESVHTLLGELLVKAVSAIRDEDWAPFELPPIHALDETKLDEECRQTLRYLAGSYFKDRKHRIQPGLEEGELGLRRGRLMRFLRFRGCKADANVLLPLCYKSMFEEKMELFGMLGNHQAAIQIAIGNLHDFSAAEEYCERRESSARGDPLRDYLQILQSETSESETWRAELLSNLLSKYADRLSSAEVVHFVHGNRTVSSLGPYVAQAVPSLFGDGREHYLARYVATHERVSSRSSLATAERRGYVLSRLSKCSVSGTRIGDAAFCLQFDLKPVLMSELRRLKDISLYS